MIPVCKPWLPGKEIEYVNDALSNNWISSAGDYITKFEEGFSKFCGVKYGVSCSSGLGALHLACAALGLKKGDEVIAPTFTMAASINAIIFTGAKPVLVDAEPETFCIDADKIEEKITKKTKAIMPVHIYGNPCEMDKIRELAKKYNLFIIEDAAEAHGAEYKGRKCGSMSDIGCFSFYANKILTTGEGGMCVTDNLDLAEKMKKLRNHAFDVPRFIHKEVGFNYRLTNIQAAIGTAQVENAEMLVNARRNIGLMYNKFFKDVKGLILPVEKPYAKNVYWMYGVVLSDKVPLTKEEVMQKLKEKGIDTRSFFIPMHRQPVYFNKTVENAPDCEGNFKVADKISERGFYLPSSSNLSEEEIKYICEKIKGIIAGSVPDK
jgi:perosamine synthetase